MKLFCFLFIFSLLIITSKQNEADDKDEFDEATVTAIFGDITELMLLKYNVTRSHMVPSRDQIETTLIENDIRFTKPQATRILEYLKSEMGIGDNEKRSILSKRVLPKEIYKWASPIAYFFDGTHSRFNFALFFFFKN